MTSKQFLIEKNKIVFDVTGLVLIPDDQIIEHPFVRLLELELDEMGLTTQICTYCMTYLDNKNDDGSDDYEPCEECPMFEAENYCSSDDYDSTWFLASVSWDEKATISDHQKLQDLVIKYNKEEGK